MDFEILGCAIAQQDILSGEGVAVSGRIAITRLIRQTQFGRDPAIVDFAGRGAKPRTIGAGIPPGFGMCGHRQCQRRNCNAAQNMGVAPRYM